MLQSLAQMYRVRRHAVSLSTPTAARSQADGWRGFFKGNAANVVRIFPYEAVKLGAYSQLKKNFGSAVSSTAGGQFMCGTMAGVVATMATYPLDLVCRRAAAALHRTRLRHVCLRMRQVRARMSLVVTNDAYKSIFRGLVSARGHPPARIDDHPRGGRQATVYREGGFRGMYIGLAPTIAGIIPYAGVRAGPVFACTFVR